MIHILFTYDLHTICICVIHVLHIMLYIHIEALSTIYDNTKCHAQAGTVFQKKTQIG